MYLTLIIYNSIFIMIFLSKIDYDCDSKAASSIGSIDKTRTAV